MRAERIRALSTALLWLAALVAGPAAAQCGPLGAAAEYPVYGAALLSIGSNSTVSNGSSTFNIASGSSGRAVNEHTGARLTPSPALTLPPLSPASFPSFSTSTDTSAATVAAGTWDDVTVNGTTSFTGGTYYIDDLAINGTANLAAGTYYVNRVTMGNNATLAVSGTVRILIGDRFDAANNVRINSGGSATGLQLFLYGNARFTAGNRVAMAGLLYSPYSSSQVTFGNGVDDLVGFVGAVISAGSVSLGNNADIDYAAATQSAVAAVSTCPLATGPTSFAVEASGGGSIGTQTRGEPFAIRVRALGTGGATDTGFTGTVTISSSCTLSAGSGTTASFVAGVLATHAVTISTTGSCTITATQSGGSATGTSNSFQVVAPSRFNAFDTTVAAGSISGPIRTKIAGSGFSLAVVAIDNAGTGVLTPFTGTVTVELLDASNNTGTFNSTTNCRSSWTSIQTVAPNPAFASGNAGRITVAFNQANAWRELRVRITHSNAAGTTVGCSTDAFAIRPSAFSTPVASDATDSTAGTTRTLNNSNATSGTVHRAGRPFTVLAQALSATGSVTTGYTGATPVLNVTACVQPAGCTAGTLTSTLSGSNGAVSGTASYSEGGVISADLEDLSFAAVDAADSTVDERAIRSSAAATLGRFVADRYALALPTAAVMAPGACAAGGLQSFTFVGQPFSFATPPVLTVTPLNAAGGVLANARPRIVAGHVISGLSASGAPAMLTGTPAIASIANAAISTVTYAASSFSFTRAAPVNSFSASLLFDASVSDTSEPGATAPITGTLSPSAGPLSFTAGAGTFHYGRLTLRSTYGEQTRALFVPLEVQRFNGSGWVGLPEAGACIAAAPAVFAYSSATGALAASGSTPNCASRVAATVTTSNGRALLRLAAPPANGSTLPAAMTVTLNLLAAPAGQTCNGSTLAAAGTLAMPWLAGPDAAGNYTASPAARISWGRTRGDYVDMRERFD